MFPITIIVRGLETEPIDALKIGATQIDGEKFYFILTPDMRVASVREKDCTVYWDNTPSEDTLKGIDRMIEIGDRMLRQKKEQYAGPEVG